MIAPIAGLPSVVCGACPNFVWAGFAETRFPASATPGHTNEDTTCQQMGLVWSLTFAARTVQFVNSEQQLLPIESSEVSSVAQTGALGGIHWQPMICACENSPCLACSELAVR